MGELNSLKDINFGLARSLHVELKIGLWHSDSQTGELWWFWWMMSRWLRSLESLNKTWTPLPF